MKKIVFIMLLAIMPLMAFAGNGGRHKSVPEVRLSGVIDEFRGNEGFEVVRLGRLATSVLKTAGRIAARSEGDEEMAQMLGAIKGIKKVTVVDFSECSHKVRERFNSKVSRLLRDCDLLMEAREDDEAVYIYGIADEDSSVIRDFVVFSPGETLVCLCGTISVDSIIQLMDD